MSGEMKKFRKSVFNYFHSVRFYDLFHKNENMLHSINIYSSKTIIHNNNEITKNDFAIFLSKIMDYQPDQNSLDFRTKNQNYLHQYKENKKYYDSQISNVFRKILEQKNLINETTNVSMVVNYELNFSANTYQSFTDYGNENKNCNNDVIIIRFIVCQKSFCGKIILNHSAENTQIQQQKSEKIRESKIDNMNNSVENTQIQQQKLEKIRESKIENMINSVQNTQIQQQKSEEIRESKIENRNDECSICMLDIKHKIAMVPCGHTRICEECIGKLDRKNCPFCESKIDNYIKIYL
jgi:Na+-transporting NADH:ubiquinone oxidoreductase subunit NqrC